MTTRERHEERSRIDRVVALGASNLTRGFRTVVSTARGLWGPEIEVFAALGHGRSYGARSVFLWRVLPGILDAGLWQELERRRSVPTRALITDVGNDIIYGFSVEQILEWIDATIIRLQRFTDDIVLTDLPAANIEALSPARFYFFRTLYAPSCRLRFDEVADRAVRLNDALTSLAELRHLRFVQLRREWYTWDPIHISPSYWRPVWRDILMGAAQSANPHLVDSSWIEAVKLYMLPPERRWLFGWEQHTPQTGVALAKGGRVWLY